MAVYTAIPTHVRVGAGLLWGAPLGTSEPAITATGGIFGQPGTGWVALGATENGNTHNFQENTADLTPEESFYPEIVATTGITADVSFSMWYQSPDNYLFAYNGGTTTGSGTGSAAVTAFAPPKPGFAVNRLLLWQSDDDKERVVYRSVKNTAQISTPRQKAPNKQVLPVTFRILQPAGGGDAWTRYTVDGVFGAAGAGA